MSITLIGKSIQGDSGTDSSGKKSFTELWKFSYSSSDDSVVDLMDSALYPRTGDCHSKYTNYCVESVDPIKRNDVPKEMILTVKYSQQNYSFSFSSKGKKPWQLPPSNVSINFSETQVPLLEIYDPSQKQFIPLATTAGTPIIASTDATIPKISFDFNREFKNNKYATRNMSAVINSSVIIVCGVKIPAYCAKLMPMSSTLHTVYNENGSSIKYQYETIHAEILMNPDTWISRFKNVSTLALFTVDGTKVLQPIFQYSPWTSKDDDVNIKVKPVFGNIDAVIKANNAYQSVVGDKTKKIPWSEMTEPLPLDDDGAIDTSAIASGNYKEITGYKIEPSSFNQYNLPRYADKAD